MTKSELIRFLEPFDDNIKIVTFGNEHKGDDFMLMPIEPKYIIANNVKDFSKDKLENGEGFIQI